MPVIIHLSKPIECAKPRLNPEVIHWMFMSPQNSYVEAGFR